MANNKHRAVFLDRDGTINIDKDYLHRIEDFEFIPGAPDAIRALKDVGFLVIVVTNQSGVARGLFAEEDIEKLHRHIQNELNRYGTSIDAFYYCPHLPEIGVGENRVKCDCRKGAPGMLLKAAREHSVDLQKSFMVGDKQSDIEAGKRAGCQSLLVLTGYGDTVASRPEMEDVKKYPDLACAVRSIIGLTLENKGKLD